MKVYQSHKVVRAAKIIEVERQDDGRWLFTHEGGLHDTTTIEEAARFKISNEDLGYGFIWRCGVGSA